MQGPLTDSSFCSKWFFTSKGKLVITRDLLKALTQRQWYSRTNAEIMDNPDLHAFAVFQSVKHEEASVLLEDIIWSNISQTFALDDPRVSRFIKKSYRPLATGYALES